MDRLEFLGWVLIVAIIAIEVLGLLLSGIVALVAVPFRILVARKEARSPGWGSRFRARIRVVLETIGGIIVIIAIIIVVMGVMVWLYEMCGK